MVSNNTPPHAYEDDPGGRSMSITVPNPRRTPTRDVRMVGDGRKRQKLSHSPEKVSQRPQGAAIADSNKKDKGMRSQESGSSDQSASRWFNNANKTVPPGGREQAEIDDDPPFYMSNHANYIPTNFVASESDRLFGGIQPSRLDSENEELRSVIDDLTVENKRLRQILKVQNRNTKPSTPDVSQQQDKLFEVRMHGLPPEKRRELEYLLKNFATSVHTSVPSKPNSTTTTSGDVTSTSGPVIKAPRTDSGYASNSNSAQTSGVALPAPLPMGGSNHRKVKSYLHDIPDIMLPKQNTVVLSERAKMALVVRRLEQLFTGRKAAGDHDQPNQQQEVSQSAARADRILDAKDNKRRRPEGLREAKVMAPDSKVNLDAMDMADARDNSSMSKDGLESVKPTSTGGSISRPSSPEQRPTRPLDLDIHRAQIASENIQYIRHLGLSTPFEGNAKEGDEGPWLPLNLLMSMAQLHTLNVTPEFVRKALKKLSKRFELSKPGVQLRWIGGPEGTRFAAEDEKALELAETSPRDSNEDADVGGSSSKRSKSTDTSGAITSNTPSDQKTSSGGAAQTSSNSKLQPNTVSGTSNLVSSIPTKTTTASAFDYKPIVYREKIRHDFEDSYLRDSDASYSSNSPDSSGLVHALSRSNLNQKLKEEGLITFFNNPFFCSDFSSDNVPSNMKSPRQVVVGEVLGVPVPSYLYEESARRHHDATYYTKQFAPKPYEPQSGPGGVEDPKLALSVPELTPLATAEHVEQIPKEFEVTGLGGIIPEENFAVDVQVVMTPSSNSGPNAIVRSLPFSRRKYLHRHSYRIQKVRKIELLPSKLPPPSYIFFTSSSSSSNPELDDTSDSESDIDDSDGSSSPFIDEECPAPPAFLMQFSGSGESNGNHGGNNDNDDNESSSIDMLALARRADPERIAEAERVYMLNQPGGPDGPERRAVAGSLAATVGASRSTTSIHEPEFDDSKLVETSSVDTDAGSSDDEGMMM